jgi:DNA polymerase
MDVTNCKKCSELVDERNCIVNGIGNENSEILLVGEAPGENEDKEGEPFVGKSGSLLTEKLEEYNIKRKDIRITNSVRCKPPSNRNPKTEELDNCKDYLYNEIDEVSPKIIVTLGKIPGKNLLGREVFPTKEVGETEKIEINDKKYNVLIGIHPAAAIYQNSNMELLEQMIEEIEKYSSGGNQSSLSTF